MTKELENVLIELKSKIGAFLEEANKASICADIWSKKGLSSSYLGITAHFFSRKDNRRHCATFAVRRMESSHTGVYVRMVVDNVLTEWDVQPSKVIASLTDNGSNMLAAFRKKVEDSVGCEDKDEDREEELYDDEEEDEDEMAATAEDDGTDYEMREMDHTSAFATLGRVSCFSHSLQLVVNKFSGITAYKPLLKHAHALVKKMNSSVKATERQIELSGKKLVKDCPTRWSSTFLMVDRMLSVRTSLTQVLEELEWDNLPMSEWKCLHSLRNLLQPFAVFTALVQGEEFTTVSCVLPAIMDLSLHLDELKENTDVAEAAQVLQKELKARFKKYTDPSDPNHESLFLIGTALDPRYQLLLNPVQVDSAKQELLKRLKETAEDNNGASSANEGEFSQDIVCEEPPKKRFHHLNRILEAKMEGGTKENSNSSPGESRN